MFFRTSGYHGQLVNLHHRRRNPSPSSCWTAIWKNIDIIYTLLRVGESPEKCVLILSPVSRVPPGKLTVTFVVLSVCWLTFSRISIKPDSVICFEWGYAAWVTQWPAPYQGPPTRDPLPGTPYQGQTVPGRGLKSLHLDTRWSDSKGRRLWLKTIIAPIITILKTQ